MSMSGERPNRRMKESTLDGRKVYGRFLPDAASLSLKYMKSKIGYFESFQEKNGSRD